MSAFPGNDTAAHLSDRTFNSNQVFFKQVTRIIMVAGGGKVNWEFVNVERQFVTLKFVAKLV
jgi:hypothetical protein